jgi:hypothetical protein
VTLASGGEPKWLSLKIKEIFAHLRYSNGKAIFASGGDQSLLSLTNKVCLAPLRNMKAMQRAWLILASEQTKFA